jgi:hypothetical protein
MHGYIPFVKMKSYDAVTASYDSDARQWFISGFQHVPISHSHGEWSGIGLHKLLTLCNLANSLCLIYSGTETQNTRFRADP